MKGVLIGLVFGILLGAAGVRLIDKRQDSRHEDAAAKSGGSEAAKSPGREEADRLEKDLAAARSESSALAKKVAELEGKARAAVESKPAVTAKANPWASVGVALYKLKDTLNDPGAGNSPEAQQAFMDMLAMLGKVAKDNGVSLDEVMGCPEAFPRMILSLIEASGVPLDASQQAAVDALLAQGQAGWKDYLAQRDELGSFERKLAVLGLQANLSDGMRGAVAGPGAQVVDDMKLWDASMNFGGNNSSFGGHREGVRDSLSNAWVRDLGLDEAQKTALAPAIDEYMRELEASDTDIARRVAAGQKVSDREKQAADLKAMINAQKRLGETLRLTEAQSRSLKNWGTVYGIDVHEGK